MLIYPYHQGAISIWRCHLISIGIPMLKIRLSHDRLIKWPRVTGGLIVFGLFPPPLPPPFCQHFSGKTPEHNFFKPHMVDLWVWEKIFATHFGDLGSRSLCYRSAIHLVPIVKWEPLIQSLQNLGFISPSSYFLPDKILEKFCPKFVLAIFCVEF